MTTRHAEYVAVIDWLERLQCSVNGNPRFRIHFTDGTSAITQSDSGVNYGLGNPENMGVPVTVKATLSGRVWDVRPVSVDPFSGLPGDGRDIDPFSGLLNAERIES